MTPCSFEEQQTRWHSAKHEVAKTDVAVWAVYGMRGTVDQSNGVKVLRIIVHSDESVLLDRELWILRWT